MHLQCGEYLSISTIKPGNDEMYKNGIKYEAYHIANLCYKVFCHLRQSTDAAVKDAAMKLLVHAM